MSTFVGRNAEQTALQAELEPVKEGGSGRFVWMRGRRRIGKSRLVQEFCDRAGERYCFYQAPRRGRDEALGAFAEAVRESTLAGADSFVDGAYGSLPAPLGALAQETSPAHPAIVGIDEVPYPGEAGPRFRPGP